MRYRFKGIIRDTGRVVEGHVEAPTEEIAHKVMSDNGIVWESLREDPRPGDYTRSQLNTPSDDVSSAVDSALDTASKEVDFDALTNRYKGKKVWVLDRSKIRDNVKSVMLATIRSTQQGGDNQKQMLAKVNEALDKMFDDKKNVSSQASPDNLAIEEQIARLSAVVRRVESAVAQLSVMSRGGGGGGGGRMSYDNLPNRDKRHDKVLLEIFETNLELQRTIDQPDKPKTDKPAAEAPAANKLAQSSPPSLAKDAVAAASATNSGSTGQAETPALFTSEGPRPGNKNETS